MANLGNDVEFELVEKGQRFVTPFSENAYSFYVVVPAAVATGKMLVRLAVSIGVKSYSELN